ncbi:MAG TPA: hypothetical protein VEG60_21110 [Candidatus Binatia bacterium]|nr:hypothetical protein [Candidatus Binatia bacterium]
MFETQLFEREAIGHDSLFREPTQNLFGQPDVVVIHEYLHVYRSSNAYAPEIKLIAAVLKDAIDCYLKYESVKTRRGKKIFNEAAQWIFSRQEDWLFSFDNICEILKLDPDYIRRVLRQNGRELVEIKKPGGKRLSRDLPEIALRLAS